MASYIFEIVLFQAVFLGIYLIFLRNETFFQWNRAYLLITAVLAFVLSFIELDVFATQVRLPQQIQELAPVFVGSVPTEIDQVTTGNTELPNGFWWMIVYAIGVVFSLGILFRKYRELQRYFRFQQKENPSIIIIPNSDVAFTFLRTIFLGEKLDASTRDHILAHEKVHVNQKHGLDLLFFELLRALFWFNPLIYAYQKSISEVHEYLADAQASKITEPKNYYNQLLNTAFGTQDISFINTFFNQSLIKKRIVMLHKNSKTTAKWKYFLLIPVLAGMLTYVGCSSDNSPQDNQSESLEQQISDLQATIDTKSELSEEEKKTMTDFIDNTMKAIAEKEIYFNDQEKTEEENVMLDETLVSNVPYAVIEQVPTFAGCEGITDNEARKECTSSHITAFVQKHFDTSLGKKLSLTGINKVYVQFKINEKGNVEFMRSRGPHPELEKEAERVVNLLPQMKPGIQKGQAVNVLYALPIVFQVAE